MRAALEVAVCGGGLVKAEFAINDGFHGMCRYGGVHAFEMAPRSHVDAAQTRLLAEQPEYGAWAWEIHHSTKKDSPSGTLIKLVHGMREAGYERTIDKASNRAGANPGTHEIGFDSAADTITLRHTARSREGFARGALKAAQWLVGQKGFHEFSEILFS